MKNLSLADLIFEKLENKILEGEYPPGEILTELRLSEEFQVSRTPIREAIRRLEQEGLIEETGKGAVVRGIDKKALADIYEIRMRIEGLAAAYAAEHITNEGLTELQNILELQEFYAKKEKTEEMKNADSNFHDLIYQFCDSMIFSDVLRMLHKRIRMFRKLSLAKPGRAEEALQEHREILAALQARDKERAEALTIRHIQNAKENLIK